MQNSPIKNSNSFSHIGLMGRTGKLSAINTLYQVLTQISQLSITPVLDEETAQLPGFDVNQTGCDDIKVIPRNELGNVCDLVIVVGGDGSILHAGRTLAPHNVPVLGINRGRLGFLADVNPDEVYQKLQQILNGEYELDKRFLLNVEIRNEHNKAIYDAMALNDVVLHAGKSVHMIDFEMTIDGHHVYRQHSDGLILATPTGSTAYSLSAGGPIMHPRMDAIVLVPLNPHALASRPIVIDGNSDVCISIHMDNRVQPMVSADGQSSVPIEENHTLHITKHPQKLTLLHPPGYDFYAACRTKLGWHTHGFDD